jgi:hypothetical protein
MTSPFRALPAACTLGLLLAIPRPGSAATITEDFTLKVPTGTEVSMLGVNVASSLFPQFNPADGTLTQLDSVFSGSGTWASSSGSPQLDLSFVVHGSLVVIGTQQDFFTPGKVTFDLGGTDSFIPELGSFIGAGTTQADLRILGIPGETGTFKTSTISGSITYVYNPIAEPSGAGLLLAGLVGLAAVYGRARRTGTS